MSERRRRFFVDALDALSLLSALDEARGAELSTRMNFHVGEAVDIVARGGGFEIVIPTIVRARKAPNLVVFATESLHEHASARRRASVRRTDDARLVSSVAATDQQIVALLTSLLDGGGISTDIGEDDGSVLFVFKSIDGRARIAIRGVRDAGVFRLSDDKKTRALASGFVARRRSGAAVSIVDGPATDGADERSRVDDVRDSWRRALTLAERHARRVPELLGRAMLPS